MRKTLLLSAAFIALSAGVQAASVAYTTIATFDGNSTALWGTVEDGVTFSFNSLPGTADVPPASNISYGNIVVAVTGAGASGADIVFDLIVSQSLPDLIADFHFIGTIHAGTITGASSNVNLTFSPLFFDTSDGVHYDIGASTPIVPPSTNGGSASIQGTVNTTDATIPEPATMGLMGASLLGVAAVLRRRRKV